MIFSQRQMLAILGLLLFVIILMIVALKQRIDEKRRIVEKFDQNSRLSKSLEDGIIEHQKKLNTLRNALKILKGGDEASTPGVLVAQKGAVETSSNNIASPPPKSTRRVSDLNMYEMSLGKSWLNVKNNDMDNTAIITKLLHELAIPSSKHAKKDERDYENYCIFRKATKQCVVGRTDCVDRCNPPDSKTKIWG